MWFLEVSPQRNAYFFMCGAKKYSCFATEVYEFLQKLTWVIFSPDRCIQIFKHVQRQVHVQLQEKVFQRSIKYMFNGKRRSSRRASSTCSTAREDPPGEHQVHVQRQEKILQESIKYMFNGKRRSSRRASSTCSTAREDPPGEHQVHVQRQEKILQRSIRHDAPHPTPPQLLCVLMHFPPDIRCHRRITCMTPPTPPQSLCVLMVSSTRHKCHEQIEVSELASSGSEEAKSHSWCSASVFLGSRTNCSIKTLRAFVGILGDPFLLEGGLACIFLSFEVDFPNPWISTWYPKKNEIYIWYHCHT